jgi:uncharacterized protein (DUF433 family)
MDRGHGIVSRDPEVPNGDLIFAGTRVPVKNLVDYLAAGDSMDYFLEGFPGVSREQPYLTRDGAGFIRPPSALTWGLRRR